MSTQRIEQRQIAILIMVFIMLVISIIALITSTVAFKQVQEIRYKADQIYVPAKELIQDAEENLVDLANAKIQCETDLSICRENLR